MAFIPVDKMTKLREAAKGGDERARKILRMQLEGKDYNSDLDSFFAAPAEPAPEPIGNPGSVQEAKATKGTGNEKLDKFLADNGVKEGDSDYDDAVNDYYNEFPNERPADKPENGDELNPDDFPDPDLSEEVDLTKDMAQGIIDLIGKCDQTMLLVMQNDTIDGTTQKGAMTTLQEIKQSLFDSAEKIKKIKESFDKKEKEGELE